MSDERTHFSDNYFDLASGTRSGQQLGECIGLCRELLRIDLPKLLQILQLPLQAGELFQMLHSQQGLPFYAPMSTQSDQKMQFSEIRWSLLQVKEDSLKSFLLAGSTEICRTQSHPCFSNL